LAWRDQFGRLVDAVLDALARPRLDAVEIRPRCEAVTASAQQAAVLVPVRLTNRGEHAEAADGPGRTELMARVTDTAGGPVGPETVTPLPGLLVPGRSVAAVVRVAVPAEQGEYQVTITSRRLRADGTAPVAAPGSRPVPSVRLTVMAESVSVVPPTTPVNLEPALRAAHAAGQLPAGYADVSEGRFARLKHWVKRQLLHNFQTAYVDVLSRQQSAFNRQVLTALAELGDGQAALAHAVTVQPPRSVPHDGGDLRAELCRLRRQNRRLRRRLARVEAALAPNRPLPEEAAA